MVARREVLSAGISAKEIAHRLRIGALIRVFPGVYRVGHTAPTVEAHYAAAVRACGDDALLSGLSAAWLWRLVKERAPPPEVTVRTERRVPGILTRRQRRMHPRDATRLRGIPITTVPATLVALASRMAFDDLARAAHEAAVRHRTCPEHIEAALARKPNAPGAANLHAVIRGDATVLLGGLERGFRALLRRGRLPLPETNRKAGSHYVDCRWPGHRLIVELDSYRYHHTRHAWEQDRHRDREARARGDLIRRYTWRDVFEESDQMLAELRELLTG